MATKNVTQTNADNAEADGEEGKELRRSASFRSRLILMAAGGLVALGGIGGGAYFFFGGKSAAAAAAVDQVKPVVFLDMPDVLVNLSIDRQRAHAISQGQGELELPDQAMSAQIQPVMPRLMDAFQTYLRELRPTDLDGSAGLYRLKEELTRRVNAAIAPSRINAVLFKEIVVQ